MSTYIEVTQRVEGYINRTDFRTEVKTEIKSGIRAFERRRWRFNETASSIACSAGQSFIALPSNFLVLDYLQITANTFVDQLHGPEEWGALLESRANSTNGIPTNFSIRANKIELSLIPDSAYSVTCHYIKTLPTLSADSDTNAWLEGAFEDLIAYRAAKTMWANVLRNTKEASTYAALERDAMSVVDMEYLQFSQAKITPTRF